MHFISLVTTGLALGIAALADLMVTGHIDVTLSLANGDLEQLHLPESQCANTGVEGNVTSINIHDWFVECKGYPSPDCAGDANVVSHQGANDFTGDLGSILCERTL